MHGNLKPVSNVVNDGVDSLALQWAKKYLQKLDVDADNQEIDYNANLKDVVSQKGQENSQKIT